MSCWFSQSHLLKKILYTELKETDFIILQLNCQLSNRLIPVLQAHDLYHVGVVSLMAIHYKEMKITKKKSIIIASWFGINYQLHIFHLDSMLC